MRSKPVHCSIKSSTRKLIIMVSILAFCNSAAKTAENAVSLDAPLDDLSSKDGNEVWKLCRIENQPCGLEEIACNDMAPEPGSSRYMHFSKTTFRKAFDRVAKLHPGYHWLMRDGVVNFEPVHRKGPDLLSTKLGKVSIHRLSSQVAARSLFQQAGIYLSGTATPGAGYGKFAVIDLEMNGATVRDALNAIAKADGAMYWSFGPDLRAMPSGVTRSHCFDVNTWRMPSRANQQNGHPSALDELKKRQPSDH